MNTSIEGRKGRKRGEGVTDVVNAHQATPQPVKQVLASKSEHLKRSGAHKGGGGEGISICLSMAKGDVLEDITASATGA